MLRTSGPLSQRVQYYPQPYPPQPQKRTKYWLGVVLDSMTEVRIETHGAFTWQVAAYLLQKGLEGLDGVVPSSAVLPS